MTQRELRSLTTPVQIQPVFQFWSCDGGLLLSQAAYLTENKLHGRGKVCRDGVTMSLTADDPDSNFQSLDANETSAATAKTPPHGKTECCIPTSGKPPVAATSATKRHHQPRWAFPSSKQGMQKAALQRDVTKSTRLQPNVINDPEDYVLAARRLLHRHRVSGKMLPRFSRAKSANYAALLQAVQDADQGQIDVDNMERLVQNVQAYQFPGRRYTAQDVEKITERLSTYDPEKVPESRGFEIKLQLPVVYKKQYTDEDIYGIVKRLSHYDPERCPPESRGQGVVPMVIREPSRQTLGSHVKKCSAGQVQEIVNRLSNQWQLASNGYFERSPALHRLSPSALTRLRLLSVAQNDQMAEHVTHDDDDHCNSSVDSGFGDSHPEHEEHVLDLESEPIFNKTWGLKKEFSPSGGYLQGEASDVRLEIPREALVGSVCVWGAICTDTKAVEEKLDLPEDEFIITPVAEYFAGSEFKSAEPVRIFLPYFLPSSFVKEKARAYRFYRDDAGKLRRERVDVELNDFDDTGAGRLQLAQGKGKTASSLSRLCIQTDRFSGYFCTVCCRTEELPNPVLYMDLWAKPVRKDDGRTQIDVRLDGSMRETVNARGLERVDFKTLDPLPGDVDVREMFLGTRLELADQNRWMHRKRQGGRQVHPSESTLTVKDFFPGCGCQYPKRVDWQLISQDGTSDVDFECFVDVGYVKADSSGNPVCFLPPPKSVTFCVLFQNTQACDNAQHRPPPTERRPPDLRLVPAGNDHTSDNRVRQDTAQEQ
ncbi:hypothetical protein BaRGS_00019557 [Batillaria attramentaria]|uniref:Uncharacterized protein n=1 Tax=Batillaria attramentaria TaxID=370345 RepID=A0ABD0KPW2_9CAEN